ncbi:hypothetical protein [Streptacidiphilus jiangxiensis]|uniref:Tat (Twin-arginine translocation) pathway signal sequence n=1 Tax=Streptacidiphilus jiangxiensis TaxID=235985 RepID=A0A1H7NXS7_STRJI|nr:hypothetical protein [Streptacidiphilus jiangxiensis]SEL28054.1 hypothetical protein SAMN05414137_107113 [Streptacidiphilus jiangxiensis]
MPETLDESRPDLPSAMSRRGLIKHATVAGAATVAAGLAVNTALAGSAAAAAKTTDRPEHTTQEWSDEPFMVRVVDARTGELDIFHGHRHHRVRDHQLVAELLRATR